MNFIVDSDVESTSSPLTWSIDEVVEYFKKSDISKYAELFRQHVRIFFHMILFKRPVVILFVAKQRIE